MNGDVPHRTPEQVAIIRALLFTASPTPWKAAHIPSFRGRHASVHGPNVPGRRGIKYLGVASSVRDNDAQLIAEAVNAIPALIDIADAARRFHDTYCPTCPDDDGCALGAALRSLK